MINIVISVIIFYLIGCFINKYISNKANKNKLSNSLTGNNFLEIFLLPFVILELLGKCIFILSSWIGLILYCIDTLINKLSEYKKNKLEKNNNEIILKLCHNAEKDIFNQLKNIFCPGGKHNNNYRFDILDNEINEVVFYAVQYRNYFAGDRLSDEFNKIVKGHETDYIWCRLSKLGGINGYYDSSSNVFFISCLLPSKYNTNYKILMEKVQKYKKEH